ncbi:MAG: sigma-70 family RNA polymerase sigma factor [Tepidisphaeraceae bacterium]
MCMVKYRLQSVAELARQLVFAPHDVRSAQIGRAEDLLHTLEPTKPYPLDFVVYRITDYRPKTGGDEMLAGAALQQDLALLIEAISDTLNLVAAHLSEPVLDIDDVCEKFNVTSKTIQRWRKRGLPSRRFIFADGRKRVGFLLSSVERFIRQHQQQVANSANFAQVTDAEVEEIVRQARRLAAFGCCESEIARRVAKRMRRSPLTMLHTLRKHDGEHPDEAVLTHAAPAIPAGDQAAVLLAWRGGDSMTSIAQRFGRPRSSLYPIIIEARAHRVIDRHVAFFDDPLYHGPDAAAAIDEIVRQQELADAPSAEQLRVPRDLPPCLQDLYRTPLLSKGGERALFLKFNYHKSHFAQARRRLDPELLRNRDLRTLEEHLHLAEETKKLIVKANLRLVASIARRHLRPGLTLPELVSDGNLSLMRAVESFDIHRGNRFSTYATLALMKGFARSVPEMLAGNRRHAGIDETILEACADPRPRLPAERLADRDHVRQLMTRLSERERNVLSVRFGLGGQTALDTYEEAGRRLGISKERVRQIEQGAIARLRQLASHAG